MKQENCPLCGDKPNIVDIKRQWFGCECPSLDSAHQRTFYWTTDGFFAGIPRLVASDFGRSKT